MKRSPLFSFLVGLSLAFTASFAGAVGLGVLEVVSDPGDPLRARVPLMDLGDVEPAELDIAIASVADYRQANTTRYEILSSISLHVETGSDGPWVVLTTERPIPESSSTVILDTTWSGGRVLSQHTLTVGAEAPATGGELADTIRTVSGDTLWHIAESLLGENSLYLNQTVLALHRLNPEAFIDGDINLLRADVGLRVPDLTEIGALAFQSADQDDGPRGQLSLVAEEEADDGQGDSDELDRRIAELENELALAQEEVARVRVEQEELRSRLDDLDEQISMARQIIDLQEQELAQLQASLAAEASEQARLEAEQAAAAAAAAEAEALAEAETLAEAEALENVLENPVFYIVIGTAILVVALLLAMARALSLKRRGRHLDRTRDPEETFVVVGTDNVSEKRVEEVSDADGVDRDDENGFVIDLDEAGEEEVAEQLNLAYSFHKMGDAVRARRILENVIRSGNEGQISEARQLLAIIDDMS